jgi:hypothetical protein
VRRGRVEVIHVPEQPVAMVLPASEARLDRLMPLKRAAVVELGLVVVTFLGIEATGSLCHGVVHAQAESAITRLRESTGSIRGARGDSRQALVVIEVGQEARVHLFPVDDEAFPVAERERARIAGIGITCMA